MFDLFVLSEIGVTDGIRSWKITYLLDLDEGDVSELRVM
jgi:hypothetical protein